MAGSGGCDTEISDSKVTGDKLWRGWGVTFLGIWNMVSVIIKPCINLLFLCMKSSVNSVMLPILSLPKSQPLWSFGQKLIISGYKVLRHTQFTDLMYFSMSTWVFKSCFISYLEIIYLIVLTLDVVCTVQAKYWDDTYWFL